MMFYLLSEHAHPSYWWAEMYPMPRDVRKLVLRTSPPRKGPRYRAVHGGWPGDAIEGHVWSNRIVEALHSVDATGFGDYPVRVLRNGNAVSGYRGIYVYGKGGAFDSQRSGVYRVASMTYYKAVYMAEDEWDGSDVFTIPATGLSIYLTERAAEPLLRMKLKNMSLVKNSEASCP